MRIDVQCHVFPPEFSEYLIEYSEFPHATWKGDKLLLDYNGKQKFVIDQEKYDPENILKTMDEAGIDISVISCNIPDVCLLPPEHSAKAARLINDSILKTCQHHLDRFYGLASIPWNNPQAAEEELKRASELGFKGVMIYSRAGTYMVDDPVLLPLYDVCEKLDLPLVIHPTVPCWYEAAGDYSLIPMLSFQMDTSLALMRLIMSGTLERLPGLRVVMPHAGGVLPYMDGRIKYQTEVMKRGVEKIKTGVTTQLRAGQIWYDTVSPSVESLQYLNRYTTTDHILFGTDYPFISTEFFVKLIKDCGFTPEEEELIFWKNANDVFKLGL